MNPKAKIEYNPAQAAFIFLRRLITILIWGRGTGKSTILGRQIADCVHQMPRSTGVLVAETFAQIKTRTLPSTIAGLEQHGLYKDLHYFVGRRPPESWNWPEPYEPILDYKHCIIFYNGTVLIFISQDGGAASGRGLNADWVVGDEAARLDKTKFETDVLLTNRGNMFRLARYPDGTEKFFSECPLHHSVTLSTSQPVTAAAMWIFEYDELMRKNPEKCIVIEASAELNRKNLGDDYFETAKATMAPFLYDAEVRNIRIKRIEDGFYPRLDEKTHCYTMFNNSYYQELDLGVDPTCAGDLDLDPEAPLELGADWGAKINCLVVGQDRGSAFRCLKDMFVTMPLILDDLMEQFCVYYEPHVNKTVYLWYDAHGNVSQANSRRTFAEQARDILEDKGWDVELMTTNNYNESHSRKYLLINNVLSGKTGYPSLEINSHNCENLVISMSNAPAKQGLNEPIKKNKASEHNPNVPPEHATHMSDAFDVIMVGKYLHLLDEHQEVPAPMLR